MYRIIKYTFFFVWLSLGSFAQDFWNLRQCIDYAVSHNVELNQSYNAIASQEVSYTESKFQVLPSLSAGTEIDFNFGRSIDGSTNAVTFDQTFSNSFWLTSSLNIFQGLVKYNTMAYNKYLLAALEQDAASKKNQLIINVLSAYYTSLYSKGLMEVAQNQVYLSLQQWERMQKLVAVGKESAISEQEFKSQWAKDKLSFTQAKNSFNTNLMELKQLLQLDAASSFQLDSLPVELFLIPEVPVLDSVYGMAIIQMPEIKYQEYMIQAAEKNVAISKGSISPRLYLSMGYYSYFYDANSDVVTTDPYQTQLKDNQNQAIACGIAIPVFNGASTYSKIKRNQIKLADQKLEYEKQKLTLYRAVWTALNDLDAAGDEYQSAVELLDYSRLTFDGTLQKIQKGLANATEFEAAKQQLLAAEAGALKAKLIYAMRKQMLDFYTNGNWETL